MMRYIKMLAGLLLVATLAACGGGGGSAGTTSGSNGSSNSNTTTATFTVSDFAMVTDKTTIANTGADSATLTVQALDASRNVVPNAKVTVTADQNAVFTPSAPVTDSSGTYKGKLQIGSDKSDRDITLAVTINGITKQTAVHVAGSKLTLAAVPSSPSPGQSVTLTVMVLDSAGSPIANTAVKLSSSIPSLQGRSVTTDLTGAAVFTFTAPTTPGAYSITAIGNGATSTAYQLQVFNTAVPAAVIPVGATPSLSASPNVLSVNTAGSTTNKSTLRFLFLDSSNKPVQNVRVRFVDTTTGLAAVGASIASGTQVLLTDSTGVASTQYIAGQNSSPTNGVTVKACYSATDFASDTDCPASVIVSLTVAGQALAISIGDDNLLQSVSGAYIKQFVVTVADSAGRAVPNAAVAISVDLTHYGKGVYTYTYRDAAGAVINPLAAVPNDPTASYPSVDTVPATRSERVWCANEDTNRNGNVDPGENINGSVDSNGQPTLEPRKSDLIISYVDPAKTTTDANGVLLIQALYSQRFGTWLAYKVRATATVAGSQGMAERQFVSDVLQNDVANGSFRTPPYGTGSCTSAN